MANKYFKALLLTAFIFTTAVVSAQPPGPPPPPGLPIDGGILALFAIGVGYAVKKIHDNSKS